MKMVKYSNKEVKRFLREELKKYESETGNITAAEREGLREWVASGNHPYDNPYLVYTESGWPMDYITAIRAMEDMVHSPHDYITEYEGEGDLIF